MHLINENQLPVYNTLTPVTFHEALLPQVRTTCDSGEHT